MSVYKSALVSASLAMVASSAVASVEGEVLDVSLDGNTSPELANVIDGALAAPTVQSRVAASVKAFANDSDLNRLATVRTTDGIKVAGVQALQKNQAVMSCHECYGDCDTTCHTDCHADCHADCHTDCHHDCYTPACHSDCFSCDMVYADIITPCDTGYVDITVYADTITPCDTSYGDISIYADMITPCDTVCDTSYGDISIYADIITPCDTTYSDVVCNTCDVVCDSASGFSEY